MYIQYSHYTDNLHKYKRFIIREKLFTGLLISQFNEFEISLCKQFDLNA